MSKGTQQKISKYKPPRVQITYDLEVDGERKRQELSYTVGVLANFSGHKFRKAKKLKEQRFRDVNKENFNQVVESVSPTLSFTVPNKLNDSSASLKVDLEFKSFEDFNPGKIANKVDALRALLETRQKLVELQTQIDCNEKLEDALYQMMKEPETLKQLSAEHNSAAAQSSSKEEAK